MVENFSCSSADWRLGISSVFEWVVVVVRNEGCSWASWRNVWATPNCPSRSRCIAIARSIKEGDFDMSLYSLGVVFEGKFCYNVSIA